MHLIKGNASLLDLKIFVNKAHEFEENISSIQEKVTIIKSDFDPLRIKLEEIRNTLSEVNDLIERMSKIHNQFRPKRSFENKLLIQSINNLVEQLSKDVSKKIKLIHEKFSGGDIPYHLRLLVKELLIQLIRNSISHGIEYPEERKKQNKNPCGKIEISTSIRNKILVLRVKDDGCGIQIEKLKEKALESGKWDSEEINTWNEEKVLESIFIPGISTTTNADFVSGRGVGMDIVKQKLIENNGRIKIFFSKDQFCEFIISLPIKSGESK